MKEMGYVNFCLYFIFMCFQVFGEEFQSLVNVMIVNEIYFFCEYYQFEVMVSCLMDEFSDICLLGKDLWIWLVLFSIGEEFYSIVIYLFEYW